MKQGNVHHRILIAEPLPIVAEPIRNLLSAGSFRNSVQIATGESQLLSCLEYSIVDLVIMNPAFVQPDLDIGNVQLLAQFRRRFPTVPILLVTTLRDPVILEEIALLNRIGIGSMSDQLDDLILLGKRLLDGAFGSVSPKIDVMFRAARDMRDPF